MTQGLNRGDGGEGPGGASTSGGAAPFEMDPHAVDVRDLMSRTVANLYSHLVTRPTGRAVRLAIEQQLEEMNRPVLSLVDFSSVAILDYSCADEVVAKLLLALRDGMGGGRAWVLFRGLQEFHRDPVEAVLERHTLGAVLQEGDGGEGELVGTTPEETRALWYEVEALGRIPAAEIPQLAPAGSSATERLEHLVRDRLLFRHPQSGDLLALSALARALAAEAAGNPGTPSPPSAPRPDSRPDEDPA